MTLTLTDQSYLKQPREAKFSASKTRTWESLFAAMTLNDPLQSEGSVTNQTKAKISNSKDSAFRCLPRIAENIHSIGYGIVICSYFTAECNSSLIQILVHK